MSHYPKKRFGQNFLQDQNIIQQIFKVLNPLPQDNFIEIGPGLGALTKPLLAKIPSLTVIEIDIDLQQHLAELPNTNLKIIGADALTVDFSQFGSNIRLLGNLPYNISTPLILHLLSYSSYIEDMHFMLQKEVADRIAAQPGGKQYGRLSVMIQYLCEVGFLFTVPASAFYPMPKVESAFISLKPFKNSPYPFIEFNILERLVAQAFSMRRKTIANNLKTILSPADFIGLDLDPKLRPEQISVNKYIQIAKFIAK